MIGLVLHLPKFMVYYGFSPGFIFSYLSTGQEIGWEECLRYDYIVSSGTINLNSINQFSVGVSVTLAVDDVCV